MDVVFKLWTGYLASGVEAVAGVLIAIAALQAAIRAIFVFFQRTQSETKPEHPNTEDIRLRLCCWLALSLEFELGPISCVLPSRRRGAKLDSLRQLQRYEHC